MNGTAYADEKEIFAQLMQDYIRSYGDELLRRNEELKRGELSGVSALAYVRCRELIRREFAAIRRRSLMKGIRISSAAACAVLAVSAAAVMLVPSWHDAVIGRSETVISAASPEQGVNMPAFRRNMPMIVLPEESEPPSVSAPLIVSRDYGTQSDRYYIDVDAYMEAKREAERRAYEEEQRRNYPESIYFRMPTAEDYPYGGAPTPTPEKTPTPSPTMVIRPDNRMGGTRG